VARPVSRFPHTRVTALKRLSLAAVAKKPSPLKAAATSPMKKANPTSTAKTPTVKPWAQRVDALIDRAATVATADRAVAAEVDAGTVVVVVVAAVDADPVAAVAAIVDLAAVVAAVVTAATAKTSS
jgi:hypothetical protein